MQTFVPSVHFDVCAKWLDRQRLGKQRVESLQILRALREITTGWRNHPATRMWTGCEDTLVLYSLCMTNEWVARGYEDSCRSKLLDLATDAKQVLISEVLIKKEHSTFYATQVCGLPLPKWWNGPIHESHRASLLSRNIEWYSQFKWPEKPSDEPLFWPVELFNLISGAQR